MDESDYYYRDIVDGTSDVDSNDSSEEEDPNDYRRLFDHGKHLSASDKAVLLASVQMATEETEEGAVNAFEREMASEASSHVNGVHVTGPVHHRTPAPVTASSTDSLAFFNALSSLPSTSTCKTRQEENDELFYDPEEDERDQEWADAHRARHGAPPGQTGQTRPPPPGRPGQAKSPESSRSSSTAPSSERAQRLAASSRLKAPTSDATLNCPCCLMSLCVDCQRHDLYKTQYRAMFVRNCRIDYTKKLLYRCKEESKRQFQRGGGGGKKKRQRKRPKRNNTPTTTTTTAEEATAERESDIGEPDSSGQDGGEAPAGVSPGDVYYPVHCSSCNTQVATYDTEQVYHFFSVLASH